MFTVNTLALPRDQYGAMLAAHSHGRRALYWIRRGNADRAAIQAVAAFHKAAYMYDRYMAQKDHQS